MSDAEWRTLLTIQVLQLQIQIDVLRHVLAERGVCSEEHIQAKNYEFLTQHAPVVAQRIREDIGSSLASLQDGQSVDDLVARLTEEHQKKTFPEGGGG